MRRRNALMVALFLIFLSFLLMLPLLALASGSLTDLWSESYFPVITIITIVVESVVAFVIIAVILLDVINIRANRGSAAHLLDHRAERSKWQGRYR